MASELYRGGEEVDLSELFKSLFEQKVLIIGLTIAFLLLAVLYAFTRQPIYQADLAIVAPSHNDISAINYGRGEAVGLPLISVREVYDLYARVLYSENARRKVFEEIYLLSLPESEKAMSQNVMFRQFSRSFVISKAGDDAAARYVISVSYSEPAVAAEWADALADTAAEMTKNELVKNAVSDASLRAAMLGREISGKREVARKEREDRLSKLKEALAIALAVGLKKPPIITGSASELSARMDGDLAYMRGSDAIRAEIDNMERRNSDDPYIDNLRQLEERMAFYQNFKVSDDGFRVYRRDGVLAVPDQPVKPRKILIILGGLVLGLGLGIFIALIRFFVRGKKERFA
ncbi:MULTISPECIES: Wzz/FepE/Etk N-terminal domain-containing protein [unclassified Pseudomonas]|uniref:Wzz/FepE/Etk N-terminal domain-containing protein n=1 Tax=unclassified Pseudomonas TaxID=196821 RepID=UPI001AE8E885|nr:MULTISPECIES: Wzz/FepE/Etk N-terminal domain-containing protein [unclassified Pseudomonas]MBP2270108.1 chain length determinant protein (polysaccharide antigen chain regulator) [Pseudomonas sp. BP6]MBP2285609.1 chain length determinant protein (polysaccharide antigen chain regulator) [Pseudomonas sp. BP7]HDS1699006.1 LPS O-antigen chain length determinant protein WzzB [Pseudomonas putida]HDS1704140.1 LPS O-antigen chain length determinant protein WzzB [Pseudomonas putida]